MGHFGIPQIQYTIHVQDHMRAHQIARKNMTPEKSNYRPTNKTYQNLSRPFSGPEWSTHRPVPAVPTGSQDRIHFS